MISKFSNISQAEYNILAAKFVELTGYKTKWEKNKSIPFFAKVYIRLEAVLKKKFNKDGFDIMRDISAKKRKLGVYYKVVSKKDAFGFSVVPKLLNFTHLMENVRMVDPERSREIADIKIADPEYLEEKIQDVAEQAYRKFLILSGKTIESKEYEQTRNAPKGYSEGIGYNKDQATLL